MFQYLSDDQGKVLSDAALKLLDLPEQERLSLLFKGLRQLLSPTEAAALTDEIHWSWLLDALGLEDPSFIAMVLDRLPPGISKEISSELRSTANEKAAKQKSLDEIYEEIAEVASEAFLRRFAMAREWRDLETPLLRSIYVLRNDELAASIKGMGLHELALACQGIGEEAFAKVRCYLSREQEQELIDQIKALTEVKPDGIKIARSLLAALRLEQVDKGELVQELGLMALAVALRAFDETALLPLLHKLPKHKADRLRRYFEDLRGQSEWADATDRLQGEMQRRIEGRSEASGKR